MRFRRFERGEQVFKSLMPGHPGMKQWTCKAGDWQFVICYDELHSHWTATYQTSQRLGHVSALSVDEAPPGEKFKHYPTQRDAEIACEKKYRQLRTQN